MQKRKKASKFGFALGFEAPSLGVRQIDRINEEEEGKIITSPHVQTKEFATRDPKKFLELKRNLDATGSEEEDRMSF